MLCLRQLLVEGTPASNLVSCNRSGATAENLCSFLRNVQAPDKLNVGVEARLQRIAVCSCLPEAVCIVSQQTTQVVVEAFDKVLCFGGSKTLVVCRQKRRQCVAGLCCSLHVWSGSRKERDPSKAGLDQSHKRKPTWRSLSTEDGPKFTAAEKQPCLTSSRRTTESFLAARLSANATCRANLRSACSLP